MTPRIRIIGKYGNYRMGEILRPPSATQRNLLVRTLKVAELVEEAPAISSLYVELKKQAADDSRPKPKSRKRK